MSSQPARAGAPAAPAPTVPRWEWRRFGVTPERFAELEPESVQESDELYLLSPVSDASVKVRDELMDVKQLQHVDEHGLEQWLPVLKAPFPLTAEDVSTVLSALNVQAPKLGRRLVHASTSCAS